MILLNGIHLLLTSCLQHLVQLFSYVQMLSYNTKKFKYCFKWQNDQSCPICYYLWLSNTSILWQFNGLHNIIRIILVREKLNSLPKGSGFEQTPLFEINFLTVIFFRNHHRNASLIMYYRTPSQSHEDGPGWKIRNATSRVPFSYVDSAASSTGASTTRWPC